MDVSIFRFKNRALIINKSSDPLAMAKINFYLESCNLASSTFDITKTIFDNNYFINLFRHHCGLKLLANILIPKPRTSVKSFAERLNNYRIYTHEFLEVISHRHANISPSLVCQSLLDISHLEEISTYGLHNNLISKPLALLSCKGARELISANLKPVNESALFQTATSAREEFDMSVLVHSNTPIFVYSPESATDSISDKLLVNYIQCALKADLYSCTDNLTSEVDDLCARIRALNIPKIRPNTNPILATLSCLMA